MTGNERERETLEQTEPAELLAVVVAQPAASSVCYFFTSELCAGFLPFFHAKLLSSDSLPNMGDLFIVSSVVNYRIVYAYILRCSPKMMMGR